MECRSRKLHQTNPIHTRAIVQPHKRLPRCHISAANTYVNAVSLVTPMGNEPLMLFLESARRLRHSNTILQAHCRSRTRDSLTTMCAANVRQRRHGGNGDRDGASQVAVAGHVQQPGRTGSTSAARSSPQRATKKSDNDKVGVTCALTNVLQLGKGAKYGAHVARQMIAVQIQPPVRTTAHTSHAHLYIDVHTVPRTPRHVR